VPQAGSGKTFQLKFSEEYILSSLCLRRLGDVNGMWFSQLKINRSFI